MIRKKSISIRSKKTTYDILIGRSLLKENNNYLHLTLADKKIAIISDKTVHNLQYANFLDQISDLKVDPHLFLIEPGEASKNWSVLKEVLDWLTELNFDRTDYVIAFGGGVVGDLVSLAASLFRRGINLIQVPTTLLSQVDSSVGGKTAVNNGPAKNSIGTFYHPKVVFCDTSFLSTLPERAFLAGYAEVLKMALVFDKDFYKFLTKNQKLISLRDEATLSHIIDKSLELKSKVVEIDETEQGDRALLNFGNTKPLLLVTGGSLGAKFLNDKIRQGLDPLTKDFNVLHVCGRGNLARINKSGYMQKEYVSENWGDFLAAADLVVSRAGANAMLELLSLKKVCVFVPLSRRVSRGDQIENARFVSDNNFGCVLQEEELTADLFLNGITRTFSNRETHQRALAEFRPKDSSALIYKEIVELG